MEKPTITFTLEKEDHIEEYQLSLFPSRIYDF